MRSSTRYVLALLVTLTAGAVHAQSESTEPPVPRAAPRGIVSEESLPRAGGVIVFGGMQGAGLEAVKDLIKSGEKVTVFTPLAADTTTLKSLGANVLTGDLRSPEDLKIAFAAAPYRVVLSAIDSGDADRGLDVDGTRNVAAAAKAARIPRMVMMSATGAAESASVLPWYVKPFHGDLLKAKAGAEAALKNAGVGSYTIVRIGWLTDKPPTGKAELGPEARFSWISAADAGRLLADVVKQDGAQSQLLFTYDAGRISPWLLLF
jgi:uncharacterized protein YbjT (DUF2867 family)